MGDHLTQPFRKAKAPSGPSAREEADVRGAGVPQQLRVRPILLPVMPHRPQVGDLEAGWDRKRARQGNRFLCLVVGGWGIGADKRGARAPDAPRTRLTLAYPPGAPAPFDAAEIGEWEVARGLWRKPSCGGRGYPRPLSSKTLEAAADPPAQTGAALSSS